MDGTQGKRTRTAFLKASVGAALLGTTAAVAEQPTVIDMELGFGYDSNPAQRDNGPTLGFIRYALNVAGEIAPDDNLQWGLNTWYRDYEGANDNYRLRLHGDWSKPLEQRFARLTLSAEGTTYRDELVLADERDELALGTRYERILSARADVGIYGELRWLSYRHPSTPWEGRPGSEGRRQSQGKGNRAVRRDDWLGTLEWDGTWHLSSTLSGTLLLRVVRRDSPVRIEAYDQFGAGFVLSAQPAPGWQLELGTDWNQTTYKQSPRRLQRRDDRFSLSISIQRVLEQNDLYCTLDLLDHTSNLKARSFEQTVTQCGLAWHF